MTTFSSGPRPPQQSSAVSIGGTPPSLAIALPSSRKLLAIPALQQHLLFLSNNQGDRTTSQLWIAGRRASRVNLTGRGQELDGLPVRLSSPAIFLCILGIELCA